jgi:hypothetical protein
MKVTPKIYVDDLTAYPLEMVQEGARRWGVVWCHMWCDPGNEDHLHRIANRIGMKRNWFQNKPGFPHYDLLPGKRLLALKLGVIPKSLYEWCSEQNENRKNFTSKERE